MRALFIADFRLASAFDHPFQHPIDIRSAQPAGEFAVAKRARATLAEQIVVFTVEWSTSVEGPYRRHAILHGLSPFQNQWPKPSQCEIIRRQKSARPRTNNDRPLA